jgi:hypothetical protein
MYPDVKSGRKRIGIEQGNKKPSVHKKRAGFRMPGSYLCSIGVNAFEYRYFVFRYLKNSESAGSTIVVSFFSAFSYVSSVFTNA